MAYILSLVLLAATIVPMIISIRSYQKGRQLGKAKKALLANLGAFSAFCLVALVFPLGGFVSAAAATSGGITIGAGLGYLAMALSTGLACVGAGIAVAHGSAAAIGAITEEPKVFGRAMIFVVLGEGIAIYGLIISFLIFSKL